MSLISLLIVLIVFGLIWYLVNQLPLPAPVKTVITVVFILILILIVLNMFIPLGGIRIGR
jgi:hypothetical protein